MTSLQRKLLSVEDQLAARPDVDDVFAKNRKLMSLIDKYKSELTEAHHEIRELKSRLVDTADAKVCVIFHFLVTPFDPFYSDLHVRSLYHSMGHIIRSHAVCVCVCLSVCLSVGTPTVAFFNQSLRNLALPLGSKKEELIRLGAESGNAFLYFNPKNPKFTAEIGNPLDSSIFGQT